VSLLRHKDPTPVLDKTLAKTMLRSLKVITPIREAAKIKAEKSAPRWAASMSKMTKRKTKQSHNQSHNQNQNQLLKIAQNINYTVKMYASSLILFGV